MQDTNEAPSLAARHAGRGRIYEDITETIGGTPLVRLNRMGLAANGKADVLLKLEFFNPLSSVKDRIGLSMIERLEAEGRLLPQGVLIEPTSGNTGIGLAFVAAARGYRLIIVMPDSVSIERRQILSHLGAELVLTPGATGMRGAVARARELLAEIPGSISPGQFENPANPDIHARTTAEEIWTDTGGQIDALVVGVGTGGTLTGCARVLKARRPGLQVIAVEPEESPVLSGGVPGPHKIQGIGAGFKPDVLDISLVDEIIRVPSQMALEYARVLARIEGIPGGISTGANLAAAFTLAARDDMTGQMIVTFAPSSAERYLSTELIAIEPDHAPDA